MKQFVIILLFSLLTPTVSHSQTIYPSITTDSLIVITPEQLKTSNLIFSEHKFFSEKIDLLENQITDLERLNSIYVQSDSLKNEEINIYREAYEDSLKENTRLKKKKNIYKYFSFSSLLVLLGILICK